MKSYQNVYESVAVSHKTSTLVSHLQQQYKQVYVFVLHLQGEFYIQYCDMYVF